MEQNRSKISALKFCNLGQIKLKIFLIALTTLMLIYKSILATMICSANLNEVSSYETENSLSFSEDTDSRIYSVKTGPISNNIYYMVSLYLKNYTAILKMNPDNSLKWLTGLKTFEPILKSLIFDQNEQSIYLGTRFNPVNIINLYANNGSIISAQEISTVNGTHHINFIHPLNDNSGYITIGILTASNCPYICKYLFSASTSITCQKVPTMSGFAQGQLRITENQFLILGVDASPTDLHFYKITFNNTAVDWATKMAKANGACSLSNSDFLFNNDSTQIYSFFIYGSTQYLYFVTLNASDGTAIGNRYKSNISCSHVWSLKHYGDYLVVTPRCTVELLLLFNLI